jgi:hypothetical protein
MKNKAILFLLAPLFPAFGQARQDSGDIMDFLVQSQMVEFRPGLSRDPFSVPSDHTSRSAGILIDEITIKGRVVIRNKPYALILDAYHQAQHLPVGFRFLDGEIKQITDNSVIFNQWDANSTNRSASRPVTKFFKREEDK